MLISRINFRALFRYRNQVRSAQFNLFPLPNVNLTRSRVASVRFSPNLARLPLSHTVKELVSRGLKSRSGGFTVVSTAIDVLSLGRPPSWRRGDPRLPGRRGSIHFLLFFGLFFRHPSQPVDSERIVLKNLTHAPPQTGRFFEKQRENGGPSEAETGDGGVTGGGNRQSDRSPAPDDRIWSRRSRPLR